MVDLESAAEAALAKVGELESQLDASEGGVDDLKEKLGQARARLDGDWSALEEAVTSLVEKTRELKATLHAGGLEAREALGELVADLRRGHDEAVEELGGARDAVVGLRDRIPPAQAEVSAKGGETEAKQEALAEKARGMAEGIHGAFAQVTEFLENKLTPTVREMQSRVRDEMDGLGDVFEAAHTRLQESSARVADTLADAEDTVRDIVDDLDQHAESVVLEETGEAGDATESLLAELREMVSTLARSIEGLERTIADRRAKLAEAQEGLSGDTMETDQALLNMIEALGGMRELMARYTFVQI